MSILPETTCERCHRRYSSVRISCPYCGHKKEKEARRTVPEADSAVRGTTASARTAENLNWQMLFGTVLVIAILAVVIIIVSIGVGKNVEETAALNPTGQTQTAQRPEGDNNLPPAAATAVPTPTAAPTPVPSATPPVSMLSITFLGGDMEGFTEQVGDEIQLDALKFPVDATVPITWSSTDENVAIVDDTGLVTLVGTGNCYIVASAGGIDDRCQVISNYG